METTYDNDGTYEAPSLEVVGTLHEITKNASETNSDSPQGIANTAFPVAS